MQLYLKRLTNGQDYVSGRLYINDIEFCDTLESSDRLPAGTYNIKLSCIDEQYKRKGWARHGKVPTIVRLGYKDTWIFIGTSASDNRIVVGAHKKGNLVLDSQSTYLRLLDKLTNVFEKITLTIE